MRNYIELNGISSEEIKGLLIQSLPPISKPAIRTQIEEIDGRDGDVVTQLGYAAYGKEITIGLYGDYDIDEVIEYFNSEGTVTFSNEPDKIYNYQILNQIDFERLIRFRTATVTFHIQPFKFSTDELPKTFESDPNLLIIPSFTQTKQGVTISVSNGTISVSGTAAADTEFYVPTSLLNLNEGSYTLSATTTGTNAEQSAIRLIYNSPSNANSFGGKPVYLKSNDTVTIEADIEQSTTYNYLWFYVLANQAVNYTMSAILKNDDATDSVVVQNNGNIYSRPTMTLTGTGTVNLSLNGNQLFVINFGSEQSQITIDTTAMEAYQGSVSTLMNRYVSGDYNNFKLNVGSNTISWTGDLAQIVISNYSRWI